jgi:Cu(I)/Ag(I) efflux system membrane protein CusA/SilA
MEGTPVYVKDIATVQIGGDFRRGALDVNGHEGRRRHGRHAHG